jgi:peptide deformylase
VKRPENIVFKYQDIREKWHEEEFDGLLARAIQHEIDHLNGVLIIDLVSEMQRVRVNQEIKKIKKHSEAKLKQQSITKRFVL